MTTMTHPEQATVAAEIRLFFGPEIDDETIDFALRLALDDLRMLIASDQLLEAARRLAMVRLDAIDRSVLGAGPARVAGGRMP